MELTRILDLFSLFVCVAAGVLALLEEDDYVLKVRFAAELV